MRNTILFSIIILSLFSCKKDKFTTIPQLKFKSVNTKTLNRGQTLVFTLSFTDAEGDLTDKIIVRKFVRNCAASSFVDSSNSIPSFPSGKNQSGEIIVSFNYNSINPLCNRNDTALFKFVLKDKAQNRSDTATSDQVVIIR